MPLAKYIDHTLLKPTATLADIRQLCGEAAEWKFAAVCVPPYYVRDARAILEGTEVRIATVIGFPFGYSHYESKAAEARAAVAEGAQELDMVMNLAAFRSNDPAWLESEVAAVLKAAATGGALVKVIIESGILSEEEIVRCCELYRHYPVAYLKTSTGYAERGASVEAVQLMRRHLPDSIRIKASGGIRTATFAQELVAAGADRLGCSASVAIVQGEEGSGY